MLGGDGLKLILQVGWADDGFGAQPHHQLVADGGRGLTVIDPALQLRAAGRQDAKAALASARALYGRGLDPARRLQPGQFAIDLLMRGLPEMADGAVETSGKLRPRTGALGQGRQKGVGQGHGVSIAGRRGGQKPLGLRTP